MDVYGWMVDKIIKMSRFAQSAFREGARPPLNLRSWDFIASHVTGPDGYKIPDYVRGDTNSYARERHRGGDAKSRYKVTLFRDNHAWCPYCQKVWLFMEEKRLDYRVEKITMRCYGEKERWYTREINARGLLPALLIEDEAAPGGRREVVTESDALLERLEGLFGPLGAEMNGKAARRKRGLERQLFGAWCDWLCRPSRSAAEEARKREQFRRVCGEVEAAIEGPYFNGEFSIIDVIFTPYVERMQASLYYYKGFNMRAEFPKIDAWFSAMEGRACYRGTKSDHHTHCHDLPPQMGGCEFAVERSEGERKCAEMVDNAGLRVSGQDPFPAREIDEDVWPEESHSRLEALHRFLLHRKNVEKINPVKGEAFDVALRAVCTVLLEDDRALKGQELPEVEAISKLPRGSALALLFIRDRLSIPRDMSFWAGRRFREALGNVAHFYGEKADLEEYRAGGKFAIPKEHRLDTDPAKFRAYVM